MGPLVKAAHALFPSAFHTQYFTTVKTSCTSRRAGRQKTTLCRRTDSRCVLVFSRHPPKNKSLETKQTVLIVLSCPLACCPQPPPVLRVSKCGNQRASLVSTVSENHFRNSAAASSSSLRQHATHSYSEAPPGVDKRRLDT